MGDYEEKINHTNGITEKIHYLSGAIYIERSNGTSSFYYAYTDYLGSLIALTNESGTVVERYAYDPWGKRRNPANWAENDSRTTWIVNRGYTGHEHLDAFGIINMNGRVYDPLTAMFFSPDPFVQAPDNWLNYNRYAYAYGNPFRYTDPSGEFILTTAAIIAISTGVGILTGGYTGYKIAQAKGYSIKDGETWAYMLGGAAIGGLAGWAGSSLSTGLSASIIASGGTAIEAAVTSGTLAGMVAGGITNGGMTALSGGSAMDVIGATIQGSVIGGFSGAAGSAVFQGVNQFFDTFPKATSLSGILTSILPTNTISYMAGETASQMTANILQGNNPFKGIDYGLNLGVFLPLGVDVLRGIDAFQLNMIKKYNNVQNMEVSSVADILSTTTLSDNGDLNLNITGDGWIFNTTDYVPNEIISEKFYNQVFTQLPHKFDININTWISGYRTLIQMLYNFKRRR